MIWSASSNSNNRNNAWNFNGDNGNMNNDNRNNTNSVRCVAPSRDNPCPIFKVQEMYSFEEVYQAYKLCRLRKRPSPDQIRFELKLAENLSHLQMELNSGSYKVSPYKCFIVTEPKPREIFAANFRDGVVHHVIVSRLQPIWEKKFYYGSFACRKGKGSHAALKYLIGKHKSVSCGGKKEVFFLQMDLAAFFVTINRNILFELLLPTVDDLNFKQLVGAVILNDPTTDVIVKSSESERLLVPPHKSLFHRKYHGQGIPIGNLTSQFGANVYLNSLDHFVSRKLRVGAYQRYMDDLLLIDTDKEKLLSSIEPIKDWMAKYRSQEFNSSKTILGSFRNERMNYLGYCVFEKEGELVVLPQEKKKWKLVSKARELKKSSAAPQEGTHPLRPVKFAAFQNNELARVRSSLGYFFHAKSFAFRKKVINKLQEDLDAKSEFFGVRAPRIKFYKPQT